MKEAISNAFLFNLVITFVIVLLALFISALSYTKASKVKTRIIEEIEKNGNITGNTITEYAQATGAFNNAKNEIEEWLQVGTDGKGIGYKTTARGYPNCPKYKYKTNKEFDNLNKPSNYEYCVYQIDNCLDSTNNFDESKDKCGVHYHVIAYMYFDLPLVENFKIAINGDTKTFMIRNS